MTVATDRAEARRMDGNTIESKAPEWRAVTRLQRAGLVRVEVKDRRHAVIWATAAAKEDADA